MTSEYCPACGKELASGESRCRACAFDLNSGDYPYVSEDEGPPDTWDETRKPHEDAEEEAGSDYF